ncbi:hypothetical protein FC17_GL001419 [Secundilactobacillus paracollinoides DSM 15502 = JCM 11969]|nr:hypothetical protein FC17_GL001419 [Secundilactobacillus paracollinoides DSM 15502 = JCM 11969]
MRYNHYLGGYTYKILYNDSITKKHQIAYLHWYSKNKVGIKYSIKGKYSTYNSRKAVYNYPYAWIG